MSDIVIRPLSATDRLSWREMWAGYCDFYQTTVPADVTESLWRKLAGDSEQVKGLIAIQADDGQALGFANYVLNPHTWSDQTLCYLEDLFVKPEARGRGVGHALITRLIELGKATGWRRVYWHTNVDNAAARRLYDQFGPADPYVRYTVTL